MNGRNDNFQYEIIRQLRFPMIVLVTFAHSYGEVAEGFSLLASEWNTYEFLKLLVSQTLVKVAVPVFFIMSGYLFFANVEKWSLKVYKAKILRRVKTLLIPYLIWNLLMAVKLKSFSWSIFWVFWCPAGIQTDWFGQEQLMTAPANMPLWFLRDLMVVSLLTPIIYIGVRKFGSWLLALLTILYLSGICAFIPGLSAYAVYFFTFGAFFSIRRMDLLEKLRRFERLAYFLSIAFAIAMMLTYNTPAFSSLMLCFRLVGAVAIFCLASRILSSTTKRLPSLVCDSAYFIYLSHYVFFFSFIDTAFFSILGTSTPALSIHYLLAPLLKFFILTIIYHFKKNVTSVMRILKFLYRN
jgi:peptidoglycan/LPS O-acetylase OafA/YrhL